MVDKGYDARIRRAHLQADRGLRRIRLPREPRRELCAAGLRERVDQAPPSRCVSRRAAQQPADGLLCAGATRARRARAWRAGAAGGRAEERVDARELEAQARGARLWPVRLGFNRLAGLAARSRRAPGGRARAGSVRRHRRSGAPRRASTRARCSCCRKAMRCGRSSATVTRLPGAPPASTPAPRAMLREHAHARSAGRAAGAHRRRRTAGRLPQHRPVADQPSAGAAARAAGRVQGAAGGRAARLPQRAARARQRPGHAPPAPRDRQGRGLRDAGGRDRRRQRDRLAAGGRSPAQAAAGRRRCSPCTACGSAKARCAT